MLSKRCQKEHRKKLEAEIANFSEDNPNQEPLSDDAKLLKEKGIVKEQWIEAGTKIEYKKSELQRGGWNMPGPINLDEEEEANVEQDDLQNMGNNFGVSVNG